LDVIHVTHGLEIDDTICTTLSYKYDLCNVDAWMSGL